MFSQAISSVNSTTNVYLPIVPLSCMVTSSSICHCLFSRHLLLMPVPKVRRLFINYLTQTYASVFDKIESLVNARDFHGMPFTKNVVISEQTLAIDLPLWIRHEGRDWLLDRLSSWSWSWTNPSVILSKLHLCLSHASLFGTMKSKTRGFLCD